jgi:hypothetical protein
MASTFKIRCANCETVDKTKVENSQRYCQGINLHGNKCNAVWLLDDDWRYFYVETTFTSNKAYQTALKIKQGANLIAVIKESLTTP